MKEKVIIFGVSDFAEIVHEYLSNDPRYRIVGFTIDNPGAMSRYKHLPVVPFSDITSVYDPLKYKVFVAIGYSNLNHARAEKYAQCKDLGYPCISYVHPSVHVWETNTVGENCFILENTVLEPYATIGNNVVVWSQTSVLHHAAISDHVFVSSGVVICGHAQIGSYCFLGANSTIRDGINISQECVVSAGVFVSQSTKKRQLIKQVKPCAYHIVSTRQKI